MKAFGLLLCLAFGCSSPDRPPPFDLRDRMTDAGGDVSLNVPETGPPAPPAPDAEGLCGNEILSAIEDRPNLYFVIDRSGSMAEENTNGIPKYSTILKAIATLLRAIGHRVNYGAAVFPAEDKSRICEPGHEVFPTTPGDPLSYGASGQNGPVLTELANTLLALQPAGGTPISPTFAALEPALGGLQGRTHVILATDGAPNCNPQASCAASECEANLAGLSYDGRACDDSFNCCDASNVGSDGPLGCVDAGASEVAVKALADAGIQTYVVGMPGSELFANVLNRLALAGNTARATSPRYYATSDTTELTLVLREIGVKVAISCDIVLANAPQVRELVNVYFDTELLVFDETNGWTWTSDTALSIRGTACDRLMSGDVLQVQVVSGCPTYVK